MAVAAVWWDDTADCGTSPAQLETYSALGGDPILFDKTGTAQASVTRQKPNIAGPDGGDNTFLGFVIGAGGSGQCSASGKFPGFFGTSAATPHVAASAALLLQLNSALTPAALYTALENSAASAANYAGSDGPPVVPPGTNYAGGYGFIQADKTGIAAGSSGAPVISASLNPTTIAAGGSSTYMWSVTNATTCTASGAWSGTQSLSGTLPITQSTAGMYNYTLTCSNNDGGQSIDTEVLTVTSSGGGGGGGGGALDLLALLALGAAAGTRLVRRRHR